MYNHLFSKSCAPLRLSSVWSCLVFHFRPHPIWIAPVFNSPFPWFYYTWLLFQLSNWLSSCSIRLLPSLYHTSSILQFSNPPAFISPDLSFVFTLHPVLYYISASKLLHPVQVFRTSALTRAKGYTDARMDTVWRNENQVPRMFVFPLTSPDSCRDEF